MRFNSYMQEICRIGLIPLHISFIGMTFSPYPLLEIRRKYYRFWKTEHIGNFIFGPVLIMWVVCFVGYQLVQKNSVDCQSLILKRVNAENNSCRL